MRAAPATLFSAAMKTMTLTLHELTRDWKRWSRTERALAIAMVLAFAAFQVSLPL
jgi:hypothetical protein